MKLFLVLSAIVVIAVARPEPPRNRVQAPQAPSSKQQLPREYGAPPPQEYGPPPPPQEYGPPPTQPSPVYGYPNKQLTITKNVYVHIPPPDTEDVVPVQTLQAQQPKKHYKIIFIKAPEAPKQTTPIIPPQPQDEHKTLVYVLVKKPDAPAELVLPLAEPTQPSKPEVYFIKYKKSDDKPQGEYGPPKEEYGPPAGSY